MAVIQGNAHKSSVSGFYPKTINGSLRFNDDDSAYLSWTPDSVGNRQTFTISFWVKRCSLTGGFLFTGYSDANNRTHIRWDNGATQLMVDGKTGGTSFNYRTNAVFRDFSAWYHCVVVFDTTNATANDRVVIYVNGVRQSIGAQTSIAQNASVFWNNNNSHYIGIYDGSSFPIDDYLADVYFIDGQALSASDFGETKNGVWVAKDYAGTFGTNGFHLTFEDDTEVEAFNTVLYRGTGTTQNITGVGFQPDLVWIKNRSVVADNALHDSIRGTYRLESNTTDTEVQASSVYGGVSDDGFQVTAGNIYNVSGYNYVAWCWKAGDSNVSNTDGSITSTVRANDTYGFSIVSYTGNGSTAQTIGHGLSTAPSMIFVKNRSSAESWRVGHDDMGWSNSIKLDEAAAQVSGVQVFNGTAPTTSVFSVGSNTATNENTSQFIAYCWAEKSGYSKFGSYEGGTSNNKITTGFAPACVLIKNIDVGYSWFIFDNTRTTTDTTTMNYLNPTDSAAENQYGAQTNLSFQSDGFTMVDTAAGTNGSGDTFIYAAFADTREAAFWLDQSGNDNDWQPVNLDHNDTVADSPTDNFATINPLGSSTGLATISDGNLVITGTGSNNIGKYPSTIGVSSGQYYAEFTISNNTSTFILAVSTASVTVDSSNQNGQETGTTKINMSPTSGSTSISVDGSTVTSGLESVNNGDVIGVALDADASKVYFYRNGSTFGSASGYSVAYADFDEIFFIAGSRASSVTKCNFGQQPFKYNPPS